MPKINIVCERCQSELSIDDSHLGKSAKCPQCGERTRIRLPTQTEPQPEREVFTPIQTESTFRDPTDRSQRYPALRAISILYKASGIIALVASLGFLAYGIMGYLSKSDDIRYLALVPYLFGGGFTALALSEIIKLFVDIEHNTRLAKYR